MARLHLGPGGVLAVIAFFAYLALGAWFALVVRDIDPDTWSRTGNAYYVLFSRDPHLAAIGFVWGPLPSLLLLPMLPLSFVAPPLSTNAFAANILSAAFMAGSVAIMWRIVERLLVPRLAGLAIVVLYAANPEIAFFGANGMSEAIFLCMLLAATLALLAWLERRSVHHLVIVGVALGLAYLTRYEAASAAATTFLVIGLVSLHRAAGRPMRERILVAAADVAIAATPFVAAFAAFALASWIVVGTPFATFDSVYGNVSQVEIMGDVLRERTGVGTPAAVPYVRDQVLGLQPALPLVLGIALAVCLKRRDLRVLAPIAVFGAVLVFAVAAFLSGSTFGSLRFYIAAIPLTAVLSAIALARTTPAGESTVPNSPWKRRLLAQAHAERNWSSARRRAPRVSMGVLAAVLVGSLAIAAPTGLATRLDPKLGDGRAQQGRENLARTEISQEVARWLDDQELPPGSVLLDVATGFRLILQSRRPSQFVITPDRDFPAALANPGAYGVRYLVVPTDMVLDQLDALTREYPDLYANGAGMGELVYEASRPDQQWNYRVYEVSGSE
jgi:hypothetical protein